MTEMAQHPKVEYIRMYTDGSAARKLEVAAPARKVRFHHRKKQKNILLHVDPIAVAGSVMAVFMLVVMIISTVNLCVVQKETLRLENYVTQLRTENATLRAEYEAGYDIEQIERSALALGMVPRDQVRHVTVQIEEPQAQQTGDFWYQLRTFLTGLFA